MIELQKHLAIPNSMPLAEPICLPRPGRLWTEDDLWALAGHEKRYELVLGDLFMKSSATPLQGRFASRLTVALAGCVEKHALGEVYTGQPGFKLQSGAVQTVRAPYIAFVREERIPSPDEESGFWALAPDLAVEIISPSETAQMVQDKVQDYLMAGVRLIWLVYPKLKTVVEYKSATEIRHLGINESLEGGDVIPGFRYSLKRLFR